MSNTQQAKQPTDITPTDKQAQQDAQLAEANGSPVLVTFDGHTYELRDGQPSPRALTYLARWTVDDENLAVVLAIQEMVGETQWELWCTRHTSTQINDFMAEINRVAGGNS